MSYAVFNDTGDIYRIAADDTAKENLNVGSGEGYTIETISTDLFNKVRLSRADLKLDNGTIVETNYPDKDGTFDNEESLKIYIDEILKPTLKSYINSNKGKSITSNYETYLDVLNRWDYPNMTYPINQSFEEYCQSNNITFYHPLEI